MDKYRILVRIARSNKSTLQLTFHNFYSKSSKSFIRNEGDNNMMRKKLKWNYKQFPTDFLKNLHQKIILPSCCFPLCQKRDLIFIKFQYSLIQISSNVTWKKMEWKCKPYEWNLKIHCAELKLIKKFTWIYCDKNVIKLMK